MPPAWMARARASRLSASRTIHVSDIQAFRNTFNLGSANLQQVPVPGRPYPGISPGDQEESNLDIEWSGAVARNATIVFVYSDDVWQSAALRRGP